MPNEEFQLTGELHDDLGSSIGLLEEVKSKSCFAVEGRQDDSVQEWSERFSEAVVVNGQISMRYLQLQGFYGEAVLPRDVDDLMPSVTDENFGAEQLDEAATIFEQPRDEIHRTLLANGRSDNPKLSNAAAYTGVTAIRYGIDRVTDALREALRSQE